MQKLRSRLIKPAALAITAALFMTMAACGGQKGTTEDTSTGAKDSTVSISTQQEESKPVTLKLITWSNQATVDALKALSAKLGPNINVEVTDVSIDQFPQLQQTRISAGDVDIISNSAFDMAPQDYMKGQDPVSWQQLIDSGAILDITDQAFIKNWDVNAIRDACTYKGKVYAINMGKVAYNGIFYNKTIFEQNNLKIPGTWTEFINLCKTLQTKGISPMTIAGKDIWPVNMFVSAFVAAQEADPAGYVKGLWTGERKFNDEKSLKIFERMNEWAAYFEKGFMGIDYNSVIGRFVSGKAAMLPDGMWQAAQIKTADPNFKFGYFCIPGDEKGADPAQLAGKYDIQFMIYAKTANKDECLKWFEALSQKENYTEFINAIGFLPTMTGIEVSNEFVNSLAPLNKNFSQTFERVYIQPKGVGKYGGFQVTQLKSYGGAVKTPKELADLAQTDWDAALAANK